MKDVCGVDGVHTTFYPPTLDADALSAAWAVLHKPLSKRLGAPLGCEQEAVRLGASRLLAAFLAADEQSWPAAETGDVYVATADVPTSTEVVARGNGATGVMGVSGSAAGSCFTSTPAAPFFLDLPPALPYLIPAVCSLAATSPPWVLYHEAGVFAADGATTPSIAATTTAPSSSDLTAQSGTGDTDADGSTRGVTCPLIEEHRRGKVAMSTHTAAGVLLRPGYGEPTPTQPSESLRTLGATCLRLLLAAAVARGVDRESHRGASSAVSSGLLAPYWADILMATHALSRDANPDVREDACARLLPQLVAAVPDVVRHIAVPLANSLCAGGLTHKLARVRVAAITAFAVS